MQQILDIFSFNTWEIVGVLFFIVLLIIQLYFYIVYYRKPYNIAQERAIDDNLDITPSKWKVSIIISSENEMMRLSKNLPVILEQDYPDFEVIVINNGSTDETDDLIESLKLKYNNLYCTYIPYSNDKDFGRRKLAYTLGAKAAKGDVLIFTEPHSIPVSKDWIRLMVRDIDDKCEVVLGTSYFVEENAFFNRVARFDNHVFSMQYLAMALNGRPFTGVYRNIAFKKDLFFDNKGFASHLALENGEDVFINQITNAENTVVCLDPRAFTKAEIDNYSLWKRIKKNYSLAKSHFKDKTAQVFDLEITSRLLFYVVFIALIIHSIIAHNWGLLIIAIILFIARFITQIVIINRGVEYFKSEKYYLSLLLVDILQPIYNMAFRTRSRRIKGLKLK